MTTTTRTERVPFASDRSSRANGHAVEDQGALRPTARVSEAEKREARTPCVECGPGSPEQIRTAVTALRGRRPRPLDDGAVLRRGCALGGLGGEDSNPQRQDQNLLCCQLHHPRMGGGQLSRGRRRPRFGAVRRAGARTLGVRMGPVRYPGTTFGGGVIGNTAGSGPAFGGSSPPPRARNIGLAAVIGN